MLMIKKTNIYKEGLLLYCFIMFHAGSYPVREDRNENNERQDELKTE